MREIISIQIGQAGVQLGRACWEMYCLEHGICPDGTAAYDPMDENVSKFFTLTDKGKYVPNSIFVDLEPSVIDDLRTSVYRNLYTPNTLISGEGSANTYARGRYTTGTNIIKEVMRQVRRLTENCATPQGFFITHSFSGGTGSGFTALLMDRLSMEYSNKCKIQFAIYPSSKVFSGVVEPYNAILSAHGTMENTDICFLFDNEAIFNINKEQLGIELPNYGNLNRLIAQVIASTTSSMRFTGSMNMDLNTFQTKLVPYPRIHFPLIAYAPLLNANCAPKTYDTNTTVDQITAACFESTNMMVTCDPRRCKYMACWMLYQGEVGPKDAEDAIEKATFYGKIKFVDWCPRGCKVGINYQRPKMCPGVNMASTRRAVCMVANSTAIADAWKRLTDDFDLIYRKKAFVHWFLDEGMEEDEFSAAREDMAALERDYLEVSTDYEYSYI